MGAARARRDEALELADRPADRGRAARRRAGRHADGRPRAAGIAALARPARRDRAASRRSSGSTSAQVERARGRARSGSSRSATRSGRSSSRATLADLPALGVVAASLVLVGARLRAARGSALAVVAAVRARRSRRSSGSRSSAPRSRFLVFFALIAEVGPVRATVITYVNPAVAAVLGVPVLSEHVTAGMVLGFVLVLAGCVLATGRGPEAMRRAGRRVDRHLHWPRELAPTSSKSLMERFAHIPPEAVLKEDLLRTGIDFDDLGAHRQPRRRDQAEVVLHLLVRPEAADRARRGGAPPAARGDRADRRPVRAAPHDRLGARQSRLAVPRRARRGRRLRSRSTGARSPTSACRRCPSTTATSSRTARR